jgi:hypothetical protein
LLPQPDQSQHPQGVRRGCKGLKPQQHTLHGLRQTAGEHLEGDQHADREVVSCRRIAVHHGEGLLVNMIDLIGLYFCNAHSAT